MRSSGSVVECLFHVHWVPCSIPNISNAFFCLLHYAAQHRLRRAYSKVFCGKTGWAMRLVGQGIKNTEPKAWLDEYWLVTLIIWQLRERSSCSSHFSEMWLYLRLYYQILGRKLETAAKFCSWRLLKVVQGHVEEKVGHLFTFLLYLQMVHRVLKWLKFPWPRPFILIGLILLFKVVWRKNYIIDGQLEEKLRHWRRIGGKITSLKANWMKNYVIC
jgi:hypothetical protein